jgi:beta-glucosidase
VRSTAEAFVEYASLASRHLGDRVPLWATLNEPWVAAWQGNLTGEHAPGQRDLDKMLAASHHLLLAHGLAVPVIRRNSPNAQVGIVLNYSPHVPASPSPADRKATWLDDGQTNRWYLDPLAGRGYPPDVVVHFDRSLDFVKPGDLGAIAAPVDFLGVNYYTRSIVRDKAVPESENWPRTVFANEERTEMGWEVYPPGLLEVLARIHLDYYFPAFYITENGAAFEDTVSAEGRVHDERRIVYLQNHLVAAARAIDMGVPLRGYFAWSLMDNFEWAFGYSQRFGLVRVDYETQERIVKDSGCYYADVIAKNQVTAASS